jgi:hypothetical protein
LEVEMIRAGIAILAAATAVACAPVRAQSERASLPNGATLNVELNTSIDSKKAKVGDKVEAHTTDALKNGSETVIPRGTKLLGHITAATARSRGDGDSSLVIQFDKALPKNAAELSLNLAILAVAAPESQISGGFPQSSSDPLAGVGASAAGGSPMGASRQQNPNANDNPTRQIPDAAEGDQSGPIERGPLPAKSRGVYGLSGLKLMQENANGQSTTVITSTGKNVRLDSGTRLLLVAQPEAPAAAKQ